MAEVTEDDLRDYHSKVAWSIELSNVPQLHDIMRMDPLEAPRRFTLWIKRDGRTALEADVAGFDIHTPFMQIRDLEQRLSGEAVRMLLAQRDRLEGALRGTGMSEALVRRIREGT